LRKGSARKVCADSRKKKPQPCKVVILRTIKTQKMNPM